jgi:hypothetical protein
MISALSMACSMVIVGGAGQPGADCPFGHGIVLGLHGAEMGDESPGPKRNSCC